MTKDWDGDQLAGAALIAAAAGSVLAMAHHPAGVHDAAGGPIHASMIALLGIMTFGFAHFALRRGLRRPNVLAGLVGYGLSLFGHVGAATINGFIVPALAARGHAALDPQIALFAWEANQALARLGVYATGAAFILWGTSLLPSESGPARALGVAGVAAGAVPAALLASGVLQMNLSGALIVYAAQAAWTALVGAWLLVGGLSAADLAPSGINSR